MVLFPALIQPDVGQIICTDDFLFCSRSLRFAIRALLHFCNDWKICRGKKKHLYETDQRSCLNYVVFRRDTSVEFLYK